MEIEKSVIREQFGWLLNNETISNPSSTKSAARYEESFKFEATSSGLITGELSASHSTVDRQF